MGFRPSAGRWLLDEAWARVGWHCSVVMHSVGVYEVNGVSAESVRVVVSGYGLVAHRGKG